MLVRVLAVAALAVGGLAAMGAGTARNGGPGQATAGTEPAHETSRPAWSVPPAPHPGEFLLGRVTGPVHTSAGTVMPRTALGNETWLLIVRHRGSHGIALIPTGGQPMRARVDLRRLQLRWTPIHLVVDLASLRLRGLYSFRRNRFAERYTGDGDGTIEEQSAAYQQLLHALLEAERQAVYELRRDGVIGDDAMRTVSRELDLEEARLDL